MGTIGKPTLADYLPPFTKGTATDKIAVAYVPSALAADSDIKYPVFRAPGHVEIQRVDIIPQAAVNGTATNYRTLKILNAGTDGSGTTDLSGGGYALSSGNNLVALDAKQLVSTKAEMSADQVMVLSNAKTGTGIATPFLAVVIQYRDILD